MKFLESIDKKYLIGAGALLVIIIAVVIIIKRKKGTGASSISGVDDERSKKTIATLDPRLQPQAVKFYQQAKSKGMPVSIISGMRTFEQQQALYNQGRTAPGGIVTNAKAGYSWHNYGLAFDFVPKEGYNSKNWAALGALGENIGLEWGGNWQSFKDKPHFQNRLGLTISKAINTKRDSNGFLKV